jgi:hypothetical protein
VAERTQAQKSSAKFGARLALQGGRLYLPERKCSRHRPLTGFGGMPEHESVGSICANRLQQLHNTYNSLNNRHLSIYG